MKAMRLAIVILLFVFASNMRLPAMAQDVGEHWTATVRQYAPTEHGVFVSLEGKEWMGSTQSNDDLMRTWSAADPVTDLPSPPVEYQQSVAPSTKESQDNVLDGCCEPLCNQGCPTVYGQVEALYMSRVSGLNRQPIVVDANTSTTYLSTSDLDFGFDPGVRATFGMRVCGGRALEFSYFGLFDGNASAVAVSPDPGAFLIFPGNFFGNVFGGMDRAQVNYSSGLNSFALNLPCCCECCDECCDECCNECENECGCREVRFQTYEWFAGFRYFDINEDLNITAQRTVGGAVEEGFYDIRTSNRLYGAQLGARMRRTRGRYGWEATGIAGIFGNDAQQTQTVTDFPNFPIRPTVSNRGGRVAYLGEFNLSALYRLTDIWNLRAGYSAIWIEGLALAPDQLDFNFASASGGTHLNNSGCMFLHGVNLGVEARW